VVDALGRLLVDGRAVQFLECGRERSGVDRPVEGHLHPVGLARGQFLDPLDHPVGGQPQALDFDFAVGDVVDLAL